jgi:formate dehydrogenase iron-sulfur subunit
MLKPQTKGLLLDTTRCIGCGACALACKERNKLPKTSDDVLEDELSDKTYSVVKQVGPRYVRRMCMHCVTPSCASACPVAAFEKTAAGPVIYHESKCMGCRYCMIACPFGIPKYEWEKKAPLVRKCDLCADRLEKGLKTGCATACPTGATTFGDRDALVVEARERFRANPGRYNEHIYGVEEVGGTSVLLISDGKAEELGYPAGLDGTAPAFLTWRVLNIIPDIVMTGAVLLGGIYWIRNRRDEVEAAEGSHHETPKEH